MPNWCDNYLEIYFDVKNPTQVAFINDLKAAADKNVLLNFLMPMPAHQPDLTKPNPFFATGPLSGDTERSFGPNNSWYSWAINNWGTKWEADVHGTTLVMTYGILIISFSTAWSPPTPVTMLFKDKGYNFKHFYFESGANFYGECNPDGDFSRSIDFDVVNITNEQALHTALQHMCERDGINDDVIDIFDMVGCYYNPDFEQDVKPKSDDDVVEGA